MDIATRTESTAPRAIELPSLSLPKGGGAIQGLGETLGAGGVSGTASLTLPLPITEVGGIEPSLSLTYSSGAGNGPFGLGMALSVPSISRRTAKGVPRYTEVDEFVDAGGEVLVRAGDAATQTLNGQVFQVTPFAPRVAGSFDRLDYWQAQDDASCTFWRMMAADGAQHVLGYTANARVADPVVPERIARWWLEETITPHGEHVYYYYQSEDDAGVQVSDPVEQTRERRAQRYLKRVGYGNRDACTHSYLMSGTQVPTDWHFELVFDYGEHATDADTIPTYAPTGAWLPRLDPFSDYAAGFEVRTHRLCRQVLMFHRFDALGPDPVLVRRLAFEYDEAPVLTRLRAAWMTGYGADPASGEPAAVSVPPLEFGFGAFTLSQGQFEPFELLKGLNDGALYQLVDLYGEGVPGVLYRDGSSYWYRAPIRAAQGQDAITYDAWQPLPQLPAGGLGPSSRHALMDLTGDGQLDWVIAQPGMAGFFSLGPDKQWQAFVPFNAFPTEFLHPDAQFIDLMGAGLPDLALIGPKSVRLYANRREAGFDAPEEMAHGPDRLPVGGGAYTELVAFSDVLGSGQSHLVRVRHDTLVVWPNLGRGRLDAPITLATLPFAPHTFDPARVRLADLDGSGAADLIYLQGDQLQVFLNQGGNGFAEPITLAWPDGVRYDDTCQVSFADLYGTGCAALVLTVPHPTPRHWIVDFVAGKKPYLLERVNNNRGLDTQLSYRSSAQAWLDEKRDTSDAVSHLPFPVQVVSQLTQTDEITGNTLTQRYVYRRGFYDGHEREFAGFGYLEQWDTERNTSDHTDNDTLTAPALTKTWFRIGAEQDDGYRADYYAGDEEASALGPTRWIDDQDEPITQPDAQRLHEMRRALRGHIMREEMYGVDDTPADAHPYTVTEYRYQVRVVHDTPGARVLLPMQLERLSAHYERAPHDPMFTHEVLLQADQYGYPIRLATVQYPRRSQPTSDDAYEDKQQTVLRVAQTENSVIHLDQPSQWRLGLPCETRTTVHSSSTHTAGQLGYEALPDWLQRPEIEHELAGWQRQYYADPNGALLPLGEATAEGLSAQTRQAEVTLEGLQQACEGLPSPGDLDQWMTQAQYRQFDKADNDYYWIESSCAHYLGLSNFYRLSHQTDAFGAETRLEYDASGYCVRRVTDVLGYVTQAEYDYRWLQPTCITDANENRHEATYDPLGRVRVTSFYGTQRDDEVGFAPISDYRTDVMTLESAVADPASAIQHAASVYYDALFSWMGQLGADALSQAEQATLLEQGLLTSNGQVRARYQWVTAVPAGLSAERWAQIQSLFAQAPRMPIHAASLTHDSYPNVPERQIRCTVAFTDGWSRALQTKQRVAPGLAWTSDTAGSLLLEGGQPISRDTQTRWVVSGRVEYNNKGLAVRVYQPYFIDTHRYVNDASLRQFAPHDTCYYDPLGRTICVKTAAGYERRSRFDVWWDAHEDENDTGDNSLYHDTPTVVVRDNRGLTVREVQYNRASDGDERQVLVTRHAFDASGALVSSADPRHVEQGTTNFSYLRTLSGQLLRTESVDAGAQLQLRDARGLIAWAASGNGHCQHWTYDMLGRPTARFEQPDGATQACRERFSYGASDSDVRRNDRGQLVCHADPAGVTEIGGYSVVGQPLSETRSFLATLDAPDWPEDEAEQNALLETTQYTTHWTYNALGETLTHTDAGEHCRRYEFNIAGQLQTVWLRLSGQDERCVASDFNYNASGQPLQGRAGNGIVRIYSYEPTTQRLKRLCAQREHDRAMLQDLSYTYDPVGNITQIDDAAQPVRYTRNQRVEATSTYRYDALHQLIQATGRESAQAGQPSVALPPWQSLDATQRVNYTRQYTYDAAGNLHQMQHTGAQHYTLRMVVAAGSNRAVSEAWDVAPEQVDRYFDANGNLTQLQPGQPVDWNACDQLSRVVQIERGESDDDDERYAYSSQGQRARKARRWRASSQQHIEDVRYLPGLERREHRQADTEDVEHARVSEAMQIIVVNAGGIALRLMRWEVGKPEQIDNDPVRYSFDNHLGSSTLEFDSAAQLLTYEEYYPYGGTALWAAKSELEAKYKTIRYSGKERDATGLYYYGHRYYQPWIGRWLNADPAETVDGLNLFWFVRNNPLSFIDDGGTSAKNVALDAFDAILAVKKSAKKNIGIYGMSDPEVKVRTAANIVSSAVGIPVKALVDVLTAPFFPAGPNPANIGVKGAFSLLQKNIYPDLIRASEYMNTDFLERQIHKRGPEKFAEALTFGIEPIAEAMPLKSLKLQKDMERVDNSWKRLGGLTREKVESDYFETSKLLELVRQKRAAGLSALSQLDEPITGFDLHIYKLKQIEKAPISIKNSAKTLDARFLRISARRAEFYLKKLQSDLHDKLYPADKLRRRINAALNLNQLKRGVSAYMAGKKWQRWAAAKNL